MSSLYKAQENLIQIIFGNETGAKSAADSYFETIPREMVFLYRDVVRYGLAAKIDRNFTKTKEYFVHIHGLKKWKSLQAQFIEKNPPQNLSYLNLFENFPNEILGPAWLHELACYESVQAIVRSSEIYQEVPKSFNPSVRLMKLKYNIPTWYKDWLDQELELRRSREVDNGNESVDLQTEENERAKKTGLPPTPKLKNDNSDPFYYVVIIKNSDEELRMFGLSRLGYDFMMLLKQGCSFAQAFVQLLPSAGIAVDEFTLLLKKYIVEFQSRGVLIKLYDSP